ncbi:4a-hydroxytetrahydrobiopterin dehydratase [Pseudomonas sp. nanlin1]|uniref:4a-hydroxytetrahydrobiopterin dehydratase n=1 Tax=Pseudomonas sp. nanlin1 TaxID=3040605 RepID=UPI00388F680B
MHELENAQCQACRGDAVAVDAAQALRLLQALEGWRIETRDGVRQLEKTYTLGNFADALALTVAIGAQAEAQDHHPALLTEWGKVTVTWWTHAIGGLHLNDFIMAARTERLALDARA